jgi:DNA invertase Pin-like site-specific DNA recombinase
MDRQASEGESLTAQQRQVEGYALMLGLTIDRHFIERGVSGSMPLRTREEGSRLLAGLRQGDVIITPKLDRMFRSALDALDNLERLKKVGVSLHMIDLGGDVTGNGVSKLVFTILSAVAEAERDRTRERIRDVKRDHKDRGRFLGGRAPFGFTVNDGQLREDPGQQKALRTMRKLQATGMSLRAIRDAMAAQGLEISHAGIAKILKRD